MRGKAHQPNRETFKNQLQVHAMFAGLDDFLLEELIASAIWKSYGVGEVVFLEGEAAIGMSYLDTGWLKIVRSSPGGREQVLRFVGPEETFNEVAGVIHQVNPATVIALEPSTVWFLPRDAVSALWQTRPQMAEAIMRNLVGRVLDLLDLVADLSLRTVTGRLARLLLEGEEESLLKRPQWLSQTQLAARLGTVPDVIQRSLRDLQARDLIALEGRAVRILDRAALESLVQS